MTLSKDDYLAAIQDNSQRLADVAAGGLEAPVPSCPGWYVASLVAHLGEVQRFWALQILERAQAPRDLPSSALEELPGLMALLETVDLERTDLPPVPAGLVNWLRRGTEELLEALAATEPDEEIWHWSGDNRGIVHMRNQALEATAHRWDVENALDRATPIDPELALDGINQHFEVQAPAGRSQQKHALGTGERYHLHRTDGPGEWTVTFEGSEMTVRPEHAKGDVAVRGPADALFLWLWGRGLSPAVEVMGDAQLLQRYRELVPSL